jgi:hypothetical protein
LKAAEDGIRVSSISMPITAGHAQAINELMSLGRNHYARIEAYTQTRAQARSVRKTGRHFAARRYP